MISVKPFGRQAGCRGQNLNVTIYLGQCDCNKCQTLHDGNIIEFYPFIPLWITLIIFSGQSSVSFNWKFVFYPIYLKNSLWFSIAYTKVWIHYFYFLRVFKMDTCHVLWSGKEKKKKKLKAGLFSDTAEAGSFKLCVVITRLGIYRFTPGLITLTLINVTGVSEK